MKKTKVWLSFDLGIRGDYDNLYRWLDEKGARECAGNLAFIRKYEFEENLRDEILSDIQDNVELDQSDRVYLLSMDPLFARYIHGKRKKPNWEGYAIQGTDDEESDLD